VRVIIAGSRTITNYDYVYQAVESFLDKFGDEFFELNISEIVSGGARGVDTLGERYAQEHNIPVKKFPADWEKYGRGAGHRRNTQMAKYSDVLIAVMEGESKGTKNMIKQAKEQDIDVHISIVGEYVTI
jgi:hypothetical protein